MNPYLIPDEDRELSVKEVLIFILKHWSVLLIVGIAGAVLLAGAKEVMYVRNPSVIRDLEETEAEEALKEYHAESELYSNSAKKMGTLLGAENEYLKSSVLMKLDPYHVPTASTEILIGTGKGERTTAALVADEYKRDLLQGDYLESLRRQTSLESVSLMLELMEVTVKEIPYTTDSVSESELVGSQSELNAKLDVSVSIPESTSDAREAGGYDFRWNDQRSREDRKRSERKVSVYCSGEGQEKQYKN